MDDNVIMCPMCYGESVAYLGELCGLPYYRCQHCGIQWSVDDAYDALLGKLEKKSCTE